MASKKLREISARIGLMSLRERVFIFAAAVVVILAGVQTLWIDKAQLHKQQANERVKTAEDALAQIEKERQLFAHQSGHDPDQAAREKLASQETQLAGLNEKLGKLELTLIPPERMNQILKSVVREEDGIRVVGFKTLSPKPVPLPGAVEGAPPGYYQHGFEIKLNGSYSELVAYLERIEALPWRLNWMEATLDTAGRPILTLTLTVHTLSLEEAWLRV
jgi:MSHA biogenesis protein MshJ